MTHETIEALGNLGTIAVIAILGAISYFKGQRKEKAQTEHLTQQFAAMQSSNAEAFAQVKEGITEVRTICIGHDGQNGLRGDLQRVEGKVDGLEKRERDRLQEAAVHGTPDRRRRGGGRS